MKEEGVPGEIVVHRDDPDGCRGRTRVRGSRAPLDLTDPRGFTYTYEEYYGRQRPAVFTDRGSD